VNLADLSLSNDPNNPRKWVFATETILVEQEENEDLLMLLMPMMLND
jgi:hypothetical protein